MDLVFPIITMLLIDAELPQVNDFVLPSMDRVNKARAMNRDYNDHIELRAALYPRDYYAYETILDENRELYEIWTLMYNLCWHSNFRNYWAYRLELRDLREKLGPHAFYESRFPPPVPVWRFDKIE